MRFYLYLWKDPNIVFYEFLGHSFRMQIMPSILSTLKMELSLACADPLNTNTNTTSAIWICNPFWNYLRRIILLFSENVHFDDLSSFYSLKIIAEKCRERIKTFDMDLQKRRKNEKSSKWVILFMNCDCDELSSSWPFIELCRQLHKIDFSAENPRQKGNYSLQ